MPGTAQVIDVRTGQLELGVSGHDQMNPSISGLRRGQMGAGHAQADLGEPVKMLLVETTQVGLPRQIHPVQVDLDGPGVPQPEIFGGLAAVGQSVHDDLEDGAAHEGSRSTAGWPAQQPVRVSY